METSQGSWYCSFSNSASVYMRNYVHVSQKVNISMNFSLWSRILYWLIDMTHHLTCKNRIRITNLIRNLPNTTFVAILGRWWTHDSFPSSLDMIENHASFLIWLVAALTIEHDRHYLTVFDDDRMVRRNVFSNHYDENDNGRQISGNEEKRKYIEFGS